MAASNESLVAELEAEDAAATDRRSSLNASITRQEAASKISLSMSLDALHTSDNEAKTASPPHDRPADMAAAEPGLYRRRPLIPATLNSKTMKSADQLLPFLENISQWTFETLQQTVIDHYNPYPSLSDTQPLGAVSKSAVENTVLNRRTVDEEYIEEWLQQDFIDDSTTMADIRSSLDAAQQ